MVMLGGGNGRSGGTGSVRHSRDARRLAQSKVLDSASDGNIALA